MPPKPELSNFDFSREQVSERLKVISIELIKAHHEHRDGILDHYARQSGIWNGPPAERPHRLFMKLIHLFHPDRLEPLMAQITQCQSGGDRAGLESIKNFLTPLVGPVKGIEFEPQIYHWGTHPSDFGFGEQSWYDHGDGEQIGRERGKGSGIGVLEAMRREHFGNLDLHLTREDLEEMEGEVELADMGIDDLTGIQLCRHISGLNLSANKIFDIQPLRFLRKLEWLDLSGNQIEDADCLERLVRLEELDLSGNQIEDISFLEKLPRLRTVDLSGNPISNCDSVIELLQQKGVMVIGHGP